MFSKTSLISFVATSLCLLGMAEAQDAECARAYTVVPGDFCDAISAAQNVSTFQLANANPGINAECSNLFVGQSLCLGFVGLDCDTTHVVAEGDSCFAIAQGTGIGLDILLANNPNVADGCTNIYPGEVLCTSGEIFPYDV